MYLLLQVFTPGDCLLTGLCGARPPGPGAPSGLLFMALGLVLAGGFNLVRARRRN